MHTLRNSLFPILFGLLVNCPALANDPVAAGRELAQSVYDAPNGDDFASRAIMTLTEKGRSPRKRAMYTIGIDRGDGDRWSLTRFSAPADIKGVGLLTKDYSGDKNDQWLYLPALDRVRRVSSSRKGGRFVGSDLFFEDLRDREVDMDHHRYAGERKLGKLVTKVLISEPVDPDNSAYAKRVSWIHPKTLLPLRVEFYQARSKKPTKRYSVKRIKRIQGIWTVLDSSMRDLKTGHVTRIRLSAIKYDQRISERLFSSRALVDDRAELKYLP